MGTPPFSVGTSLAHRTAKARLDPVGVSVLHSPTPAPRQEPIAFIYPKESLGALLRVEWKQGPHASGCNWKRPSTGARRLCGSPRHSHCRVGQAKP